MDVWCQCCSIFSLMCKFSIHFSCSWEILQAIHHPHPYPCVRCILLSFQISGDKKHAKQAQHSAECLTVSITIDWTEFISLQFTQIAFCFYSTNWDDESVFVETSCWTFPPLSLPLSPAYQLNKLANKLEENMKLNWVFFLNFFFFIIVCTFLQFARMKFLSFCLGPSSFVERVRKYRSASKKKPQYSSEIQYLKWSRCWCHMSHMMPQLYFSPISPNKKRLRSDDLAIFESRRKSSSILLSCQLPSLLYIYVWFWYELVCWVSND